MEIVFEKPQFFVSKHAIERWCSKRIYEKFPEILAEEAILDRVEKGEILLSINHHLYIRNNNYLFPCIKINHQTYIVKTVLTWSMVKERMEKVIFTHENII